MAQKQFFIDGGFNTNADSVLVGNLDMTGHIIPSIDSNGTTGFDLGSPSKKWRDLYLSQGSLYIDGQKVIESDAGTIVVTADPDQSLTTRVTGTGVLTLQSATTVSIAATLQMGTDKKITDQGGNAVTFGDKIDMDNNQVINVGAPTADGHATTKLYVDSLVNGIATDAITEGDSEIEIADLGTGTVGITVDGGQRFALSATGLAMTVPVTVNGHTLANEGYVDTAEADANTYTDGEIATATTALQAYSDQSEVDAKSYADGIVATATTTASTDATTKANAAQAAAISAAATDATNKTNATGTAANTYADGIVATATTALQTYADTAETDANAYADAAIAALVDTAPGALDTLNELAAAMGDDANFAASTATNIATAKAAAIAHTDSEIAALDFNNVAGGIAVTGGALELGANADLELSGTSEVSYSGSTIVGDDPDAAGNPAVCASSFRPTASVSNLNLRPNSGGKISLDGGDVTYGAVGIVGDDPDNAGSPTVCASTFRPVTGQADLNLRPGAGGAIALGGNVLEGVSTPVAGTDATNKTYVDSAESNAISTASADATSKANAAQAAAATDATTKADSAEVDAKAYTDTRETAITTAYRAYADQAEADAKAYTDTEVSALVAAAPGALDTLNELAAAMGDDANFAASTATNIATAKSEAISTASADATSKANAAQAAASADATSKADTAESNAATDATNKANAAQAAATSAAATDATTKANAAQAAAISSCETYADLAEADAISTASADATSKANAAQAAAIASCESYTDTREAAITTAYETYADNAGSGSTTAAAADATSKANAAQAAAEATAEAYTDARETAITSAYQSYANQAEADAESAASADATSKANAAQAAAISAASSDATSKANAAQSAAISSASSDATSKANAAQSAAQSFATSAISDLVNGASASFDTLKEIQDAMATDAELSAAISGLTIGNGTVTMAAGAGMTGGGAFSMNQTNSETVTMNVIGGNGITVSADAVTMSGSYTGTFTATGDICAYSDASLKTNVQTIEGAMGKVDAIRGVTFDRLADGSTSTGVIAQELESVLPEAVQTDENGVKMVAYGNVTGLLIEALKELKAEVESLKK